MASSCATYLSVILLLMVSSCAEDEYNWKCTDEMCQKFPCPELPEECMDSQRALLIPSTDECNCCYHCFLFLGEGKDCIKHTAELRLPNVMCGPGLTCNDRGKCERMTRIDPDFHKHFTCDENDNCSCSVINETGEEEKIFGWFRKSEMKETETQCECSVVAYKAMKLEFRVLPFDNINQPSARCLRNGQFDPLQCIGDYCGCVDRETGTPDENGFIYSIHALERNHPKCFDPLLHSTGDYYKPCEKKRNKLMQEINEKYWSDLNILHLKKMYCYPDGSEIV